MADIRRLIYRGLTVEIRSDDKWFTVHDADERIAGTIARPNLRNTRWSVSNVDGAPIERGFIGPRTALIALARDIERRNNATQNRD